MNRHSSPANSFRSLKCAVEGEYDLASTFSMLGMGRGDPCLKIAQDGGVNYALSGDRGSFALLLHQREDVIEVDVLASDPDWIMPHIPSALGLTYQTPALSGPRRLRDLAQQHAGLRLPRLPLLFTRIVQVILQQLVSYRDACDGWRELVLRYGTEIESHQGLFIPPSAKTLAHLASYDYAACGILPQHGRRIIGIAREADRIERLWGAGLGATALEKTSVLLSHQRGIGPWTLGYLRGSTMGDSDAEVPGDYSLPSQVAYFFKRNEEATDELMMEILEPYRPHRFYVLSLLTKSGIRPPRRGPRGQRLRDRMGNRRYRS